MSKKIKLGKDLVVGDNVFAPRSSVAKEVTSLADYVGERTELIGSGARMAKVGDGYILVHPNVNFWVQVQE